jgi:hypothetical protein
LPPTNPKQFICALSPANPTRWLDEVRGRLNYKLELQN